jgi:hypothetical protein
VKVWLLAKRFMVEELQNTVIDVLRVGWTHSLPINTVIHTIIAGTEETDPLRRLILQRLSCRAGGYKSFKDFPQTDRHKASYLEFVLEALMDYPQATNPAHDPDGCKWHVHIDTQACPALE